MISMKGHYIMKKFFYKEHVVLGIVSLMLILVTIFYMFNMQVSKEATVDNVTPKTLISSGEIEFDEGD